MTEWESLLLRADRNSLLENIWRLVMADLGLRNEHRDVGKRDEPYR